MRPEAEERSTRGPEAPARRAAWPLGLVGMLAIVAAAERYIEARREDFGTIYSIEWRRSGQAIERKAKGSRVLCFGSSLTQMGVAPKVLEERLGVPAYNFASSGAQPFADYTAFRHALAAGSKPKAVVVEFTWSILATPHDWNERVLPEFATLVECAEVAIASRDPGFLARIALDWAFPSIRCRPEIRANVRAAIAGVEPERHPERHAMARNANVNRGASLAPPTGVPPALNLSDPVTFPLDWKCTPVSKLYIHKFLDLAESRGIPVFWVIHPISPGAQAHREAIGTEAIYTRFIERVVRRHRGVVVVDGRGSKYRDEAFTDMVHLNRDGAVALTDDLADLIRDRLARGVAGGPAWVRLPGYRPDPAAGRVEDLAQSSVLVEGLKARGLLR